jgi:uncharacterized protein (UPF0335 family)
MELSLICGLTNMTQQEFIKKVEDLETKTKRIEEENKKLKQDISSIKKQ